MTIRLGDYQVTPDDEQSVMKVLKSNQLSEGRITREFEEKWAEFCGTKYCVATNSGTSALMLCLTALKSFIKDRKVLTSPLTFIATINAILLSGFEPVFGDVDKDRFVIKPTLSDASVFMPVHLYGYPVDMDEFEYHYMVEDACESHGTLYHGKKAGSIGLMGVFSFYIAHNIQVGDMGAIVTNNFEVYKLLQKLKAHGRMCECRLCRRNEGKCPHKNKPFDPRFTHTEIAYNFKTSEVNAALGLNQIKHADEIIQRREENVKYLNDGLAGIKELQLPIHDKTVSYLAYPLIIKDPALNRNEFCNRLSSLGVENRPLFSCVPLQQPAYGFMKDEWSGKLPIAEWLGECGMHLPCHQYLTKGEKDIMIQTIKDVIYDICGSY